MTASKKPVPSASDLAALRCRAVIALALETVDVEPQRLAIALGMTIAQLRHVRRAPMSLQLPQRLILATLVGRQSSRALIARELRRRTLAAMRSAASSPEPRDASRRS